MQSRRRPPASVSATPRVFRRYRVYPAEILAVVLTLKKKNIGRKGVKRIACGGEDGRPDTCRKHTFHVSLGVK